MSGVFKLEEKDIKECAELYVDVFNKEPWNDKWTTKTAYNRLRDTYISPGFVGIKYVEEDIIKAALFGNCEQWYEGMHFNLREMYVTNELQGKKIGSKMLQELEVRAKDLGVHTIILFTEKDNCTDKFYRRNGFSGLDFMSMMGKEI
ncbi:GNAT family N-acetyltransferase [Clostridium sp. D2Q-11]|uniref:GNAT family N-acetyltransferase n=1 Tax=Anaeromonas frigoriresistens TaxID=2683708 RepID=A0A942UVR7_9FIRM|nr:GNAT family N-acetyltransferase [Anaeromonas frigoriresistens]